MNYVKNGLKILVNYCVALLIFAVFLYVVLSMAKNNFSLWLPVYSFIIFLLMVSIMYSDLKKLAVKEKKPQYNLEPYPLKGLIYGLIGFSPVILWELIYLMTAFKDGIANRIMHLVLNTVMGPLYFIIKIGNETFWAYAAASLIVPVIAMLSYMAGYYGIDIGKYLKKQPPNRVGTKSGYPYNNQPPRRK